MTGCSKQQGTLLGRVLSLLCVLAGCAALLSVSGGLSVAATDGSAIANCARGSLTFSSDYDHAAYTYDVPRRLSSTYAKAEEASTLPCNLTSGRKNPVVVSGCGVAAKTGSRVLPIGPGSEKAWTVLNRIGAKGAPLPGYKGGSVFKNSQGRLPQTQGVTYREWDVNPYAKGVDRGTERILTGSDGSAYSTGDHYDTLLMFRGPTG